VRPRAPRATALVLAGAAAAAAIGLGGCKATVAKLSDGVWSVSAPGVANYGIVAGEFGTVVIDSGPGPVPGDELAKLARRLTMCEVTYLVNTSADPRRVLGNQSFKRAEIIAHSEVADELEVRGSAILRRLRSHPKAKALGAGECRIIGPTLTFEKRTALRMPDRALIISYPGGGPSPGASAVWLPEEKILFAGDYVLVRTAPELGESVDLAAWIASLDALESVAGEGARVVPGEGELSGPECIAWMRDYLKELHTAVGQLAAAGATLEATLKTVRMKRYRSWAGHSERLEANVAAAYHAAARLAPAGRKED